MTHTGRGSVLEIRPSRAAIILCMGEGRIWDGAPPRAGATVCRIAPDERWLVGPARSVDDLLAWASDRARTAGLAAYAVDVTDAWTVWTVAGSGTDEVWIRLSENRVPPGRPAFVQGAVATIPAKAIVQDGCIHFFTPSPLGHHLPKRILEACADLAPRMTAASELTIDAAAVAPLGVVSSAPPGVRS
jgi:hypothetical protein